MNDFRRWFTVLNLHLAAAAALAILVLVLAVKAALAVHAAGAADSESYQQEQIRYVQLHAQMAHLQGLPQKVNEARDDATHFYETRIAPNYSTILEELGAAAVKNQVRLARAQYAPSPAIDGLTEVRIDAGLSGDYAPMMHFINDLERDKNHVFFIIDGLTFTGQQGGLVNLRLRLSTYLQAGATDLPPATGASSGPGEDEAATTQQTQQEAR
jgi:type IV pilus assembly protein PilO